MRREKKRPSHVGGVARVLTYKYVNEGLKKLAEQEFETLEKQRAAEEKKRLAGEKKIAREALDKQWRVDLQRYNEVDLLLWQAACTEIDTAWAATKQNSLALW